MKTIRWGFLAVYPYGLCIAGGILAGLLYMLLKEARGHAPKGTAGWLAVLGIPLGFLGSRLGFFLASMDRFVGAGLPAVFDFTGGGYMFYGALAGLALAGWITGKITKQQTGAVLDLAAVPSVLLILAARMGEPLVRMGLRQNIRVGFGRNILDWFDPLTEQAFFTWEDPSPLFRFPFGMQDYYEEWNFSIWFPEAVAALIILLILLFWKTRRSGTKAMLFMAMYAASQAVLESMRCDAVLRLGFVKINQLSLGFVRVNQLLALPILLAVVSVALCRIPRAERRWHMPVYGYGSILLRCGIIMAMEFALEGKIPVLQWMRLDLCYIVSIWAAAGMIVSTCRIIRKSDFCGPESR